MSPRTTFLGRLFGLYCILVALAMLSRKQATVDVLTAMLQNAQLLLALGVITVIAALAMALSHNVWSGRCDGHRHADRLDRADQGLAALIPIAGTGIQPLPRCPSP
jgi:uncharacterized membrane protein YfcA